MDEDAAAGYAQSFLQNPYYFMFASLARPDDDNELHWLKVRFSLLFFGKGCGGDGWVDGRMGWVGLGSVIWDDDAHVSLFVCRTVERDVRRDRLCRHCTI